MKSSVLILSLLLATSANAAHHCVGKVVTVDIGRPANVLVHIEGVGDGNVLCSLEKPMGGFAAEGCKAIYSMLLAAKMSDKKVRLYFKNDTNTNTNCNKGSWKNLADPAHELYHVRLEG